MSLDPDDLERLVPEKVADGEVTGTETLRLHFERYEFAARHLRSGRVLDAACGVGYGTALLLERRPAEVTALGIDLSPQAIEYARRRYSGAGIEFQVADALELEDAHGFSSIVSLETLEHLRDPRRFVDRAVALLADGGTFIASVPVTPSVDLNPHHLNDFTPASFRALVKRHALVEIDRLHQVQRFHPLAVLARRESRMKGLRRNLVGYYARHPGALWRRVAATLRYGFANHYLTIAWQARVGELAT